MFQSIFFVLLRSVAIPFVAFLLLRETALGEKGALLAIGIALTATTLLSLVWNVIKIFGNTLLLRGSAVIGLIIRIAIQVIVLIGIWSYYFATFA
jgi:hypothetical protein